MTTYAERTTDTDALAAYASRVAESNNGPRTETADDGVMFALLIAERDELLSQQVMATHWEAQARQCAEQRDQVTANKDRLIAEYDQRLSSITGTLDQARLNHRRDIELIGETLLEQAERRDWCGEYDQVVDGLNRRLNIDLPTRDRDYDVRVVVTITVNASSEDRASDQVDSEIRRLRDRGEVNISDWDIDRIELA